MYVWERVIRTLIKAKFATPLTPPGEISVVNLRVWPQDIDFNLHVNNGRYLTLMDIGRMDMLSRSGLWKTISAKKWYPVITGLNARYRRSLGLFQRFRLETEVVGWTEHSIFMEHRIFATSGKNAGELSASAVVRAVILAPDGKKITTAQLFLPLGVLPESPLLPESCTILLSPAERERLLEKAPATRTQSEKVALRG